MRKSGAEKLVAIVLAAAAMAWLPAAAEATTVTYNLNYVFTGGPPDNSGPWGTISFADTATNTVTVTMSAAGGANGLSADEFISWWGFNVGLAISTLTIPTSVGGAATGSIKACDTDCKGSWNADGDGLYEIIVSFDTSEGAGRLAAGEAVTFTISGSGLDATDFSPLSTPSGGNGNYHTAIHLQGSGGNVSCSTWIGDDNPSKGGPGGADVDCAGVPEPASLLLLGTGLVGLSGLTLVWRRARS